MDDCNTYKHSSRGSRGRASTYLDSRSTYSFFANSGSYCVLSAVHSHPSCTPTRRSQSRRTPHHFSSSTVTLIFQRTTSSRKARSIMSIDFNLLPKPYTKDVATRTSSPGVPSACLPPHKQPLPLSYSSLFFFLSSPSLPVHLYTPIEPKPDPIRIHSASQSLGSAILRHLLRIRELLHSNQSINQSRKEIGKQARKNMQQPSPPPTSPSTAAADSL